MWIIKAILRLLLLIGVVTILPYMLWWVFTGMDYIDILEEIEWLD